MKNVIGSKHLCNGASILILHFLQGYTVNRVAWKYSFDDKIHKSKIYTTATNRSYFLRNGKREYLEEYLRNDIF
jgi:hypothetical protein